MDIITEHYKENYQRLVKYMTFRAGTEWDAEDVVQQAYTYALTYISSFDGREFRNWFNTILNNTLKDYKSNAKGFTAASFEEEEHDGIPCSHYTDRIVAEVFELISKKSKEQQEVLNLYFKYGYTSKDIPKITNYSYKAAHIIIWRFRQELKELYGRV